MEGACGKILETTDPSVVIKKIHRRSRPQQRTCSLSAEEQARVQEWAASVCHSQGFKVLFVPRAWDAHRYEYKMDRIQTDKPVDILRIKSHRVLEELKIFYRTAQDLGVFPADFELYEQEDGRVAMIDFDKFAAWKKDGSIEFPWGLTIAKSDVHQYIPFEL